MELDLKLRFYEHLEQFAGGEQMRLMGCADPQTRTTQRHELAEQSGGSGPRVRTSMVAV